MADTDKRKIIRGHKSIIFETAKKTNEVCVLVIAFALVISMSDIPKGCDSSLCYNEFLTNNGEKDMSYLEPCGEQRLKCYDRILKPSPFGFNPTVYPSTLVDGQLILENSYCVCILLEIDGTSRTLSIVGATSFLSLNKTFLTSRLNLVSRPTCNLYILTGSALACFFGVVLVISAEFLTVRRKTVMILLVFAFIYYTTVAVMVVWVGPLLCPGPQYYKSSYPFLYLCATGGFLSICGLFMTYFGHKGSRFFGENSCFGRYFIDFEDPALQDTSPPNAQIYSAESDDGYALQSVREPLLKNDYDSTSGMISPRGLTKPTQRQIFKIFEMVNIQIVSATFQYNIHPKFNTPSNFKARCLEWR